MNTQIPTKRVKSDGTTLLVHSIFHTIQGEGPFTGVPAVFVRLVGCNLQCPGCDTEYTERTEQMVPRTILSNIRFKLAGNQSTNLIVISGGEPFRQNIIPLIELLQYRGYVVQIETNGSMAPQEDIPKDTVVICSPKSAKLNPKMLPYITAYKYVIDYKQVRKGDGLPLTALDHVATPYVARPHEDFDGDVYVSPMDMTEYYAPVVDRNPLENERRRCSANIDTKDHNTENIKACVNASMTFGYTIQLQIHKLINME